MKNIVVAPLILSLLGCGGSSSPEPGPPVPAQTSLTDGEVNSIVFKTMETIHSDLKDLRTTFPQLVDIDSAKVTANRFDYSRGWVSDSKTKGVIFQRDGCDIGVRTAYPAKSRDIQQLVGSPFMRLGNGKYLKFWRLVRAEQTEQACQFRAEVDRIISKHISEMLDSLGYKPGDHVYRLPKEQ